MRRHASLALIAAVAALVWLPAAVTPAVAAQRFTFYGSGNGHGLGLSQWGTEGLAQMGWGPKRILTHFYQGTDVAPDDNPPAAIRIGLTEGRTRVHLTAKGGPVSVWVGKAKTGTLVGTITRGVTWTVSARDGNYLVRDQHGDPVGGTRWGSPTDDLILTYADAGARVFIPETDEIWGRGLQYGRGTIEFNLTGCGSGSCSERLIARLKFEDYLLGIGEVPASWPKAALQTQAIAARTYATYSLRHYGLRASCNCNLTDGAGDQTYIGWEREAGDLGSRWVHAVTSTATRIVTYKGAVIQTFYSASDGGHTENVEDAWHGGDPAYAIPWLTGVCDPGEWASGNPWTQWTRSFDAATLTQRLSPYIAKPIGTITRFANAVRGTSGRIVSIVAKGTDGSATLSGLELRVGLGLPDDRVWINSDRTITGAIRVKYDALMCAPGLPDSALVSVTGGSQQFFDAGGIYRNADDDLTVWLKGALDVEYRHIKAAKGVLGVPTSGVQTLTSKALSCTRCKRIDFAGGRIYWTSRLGAHALWGAVLGEYLAEGGASGTLGFPTTRVKPTPSGGTKAAFEHGSIECAAGGACTVTTA